jgi:hypothetical protein
MAMSSSFPGLRSASLLHAAVNAYSRGDFTSVRADLDRFFQSGEDTRDLRVHDIEPKSGSTILLMARIRSDDGELHFLKVSRPTDEYRFFRYGEILNETLRPQGVEIVCPSRTIRTSRLVGFLFPYRDFMRSPVRELDPQTVSAAVARLNRSGIKLRRELRGSTQQRRSGYLPNLIRRTVLSAPFLTKERDMIIRTIRALTRYHRQQRSVEKVFCHGDISPGNVFQHQDRTVLIDFANFFFFDPGFDLANLHGGSEDRLRVVCDAYADAFDGDLAPQSIRLAAVYGHFFFCLRHAAKGRGSQEFRASLERLEEELGIKSS